MIMMARIERDREDILREATAMVERAELAIDGFAEPIVIGFRPDGSASIYVGADPVYQFNAKNELRRAYWNGLLYKADCGRLASLERRRSQQSVDLLRRDLSDDETAEFLHRAQIVLADIRGKLQNNAFLERGHVPSDRDVVDRIRNWLNQYPDSIVVARTPRVSRSG
jgi:hypothetical protein